MVHASRFGLTLLTSPRALRVPCATLLAAALAVLPAPQVFAQGTEADRATARALAREGHEALQRGDFTLAEDRFRRADQLIHAPTLVVDHARALVGLGRLVEAHERYALVLREGVAPNAPAAWKRAYQAAEKEIEALKPRLAWLTINVTGPEEPTVLLDGNEVPGAALGVRRAADPGERTIQASAPGYLPREETVTLGEGEERTLELILDPDPSAIALEPEPEPEPAPLLPPPRPNRTLSYVLWGVGGAGIALGATTSILFLNTRSQLQDACASGRCPATEGDRVDRYNLYGTLSAIGWGVGLAAAGAGTALFFATQTAEAPPQGAFISPYLGVGSVGAYGRF